MNADEKNRWLQIRSFLTLEELAYILAAVTEKADGDRRQSRELGQKCARSVADALIANAQIGEKIAKSLAEVIK